MTTTTAKRHLTQTGWKPCTDTTGRCPYGVHEDANKPQPSIEETRDILQGEIAKEQEKKQLRAREDLLGLAPVEVRKPASSLFPVKSKGMSDEEKAKLKSERSRDWWDHGFQAPSARRKSASAAANLSDSADAVKDLTPVETAIVADYAKGHKTFDAQALDRILSRETGEKILYKGVQNFEMEARSEDELRAAVAARFPLGGTVDFRDVTTSTSVPELALKTATLRADDRGTAFKEGVLLEMKTKKGLSVSSLAELRSRAAETLLPRGTKWKVVAVHPGRSVRAETTYQGIHNFSEDIEKRRYTYNGSSVKTVTVVQLVEVDAAAEAKKNSVRDRNEFDRAIEQRIQRDEDRLNGTGF